MHHLLSLLAPMLDQLVMLLGGLLLGAATWAAKRAADWLKLSSDDRVRGYLLEVVENAIAWAEFEARNRLAEALADDAPIDAAAKARGNVIELAAGYVSARVPDALKHFGITPDGLRQIVQTRLSGV